MLSTTQRHIAHFDLDSFYVSVECRNNKKLIGQPVLIGGNGARGVVASCSYEARKFGIHSAMSMVAAKRLCPHAITIRGDMEKYSMFSRDVTNIIKESVPVFEKSSIDEFYIDLTGMDKFFGCQQFTSELKYKIVKETGLPISWALASNKLLSKVATNEIKPNGQIQVAYGSEKTFLAPLGIMKIPGIGKQTGFQLLKMGIDTVKKLSEIPIEMLESLMGKHGTDLWRKSNGIDESPVFPYHEQKSISTENTFSQDTTDVNFLHRELIRMTEKIAFELRQQNKLTGCVAIKLRYSNFETFTKQVTIAYTNADHVLLKTAKEIFDRLFHRKLPIRLIGVRFTHLIPGSYQINLFEDTSQIISLYQAIDSVKGQFGETSLIKAAGMDHSNPRQKNYVRVSAFNKR